MKSKQAVVFDFDGTLADSLPVLIDSYNVIAPKFRLKHINIADVQEFRKLSYRDMMRRVDLRPLMLPLIVRAGTRELRKRETDVKLFKQIPELLSNLVNERHRVGVLTSNQSDVVAAVFAEHGVKDVEFIVSKRSLFAKHKAFKTIKKIHNLMPEDIVYVGDEYRDVLACRKAGVEVIGVTWGFGGAEAFQRVPADVVVNSIPELKKALQKYLT